MRPGKRLSIDVGQARVGVATCDPDAILATPVTTLARNGSDIRLAAKMVKEQGIIEVIVGLPFNMDGTEGASARHARSWAGKLAKKVTPVPVRLVDERLSTVTAHAQLSESGRGSRTHRSVVDQAAAIVILESALEFERRTGNEPGEIVQPERKA
ncbi:MAG: Holliday junction resolvase RuvX [Ancrocorticia sp.]|uniref:Holliday junction resolvase RuvX n=1 Tax=Ancrocorticia sp. TaxID=2593684 RepID=UPI003F8E9B1B